MVFTACPSQDGEAVKVHYYKSEQSLWKGAYIPLLEFALPFCLVAWLGCLFSHYLQVFVVLLMIRLMCFIFSSCMHIFDGLSCIEY